jgi:hypothetical protein
MSEWETATWHRCKEPDNKTTEILLQELRQKIAQDILAKHAWNYANSTEPNYCPDGFCTCEEIADLVRGKK